MLNNHTKMDSGQRPFLKQLAKNISKQSLKQGFRPCGIRLNRIKFSRTLLLSSSLLLLACQPKVDERADMAALSVAPNVVDAYGFTPATSYTLEANSAELPIGA
ncbi:hypothetical protein [Shewanella benthica]|uniref:Uncharacterized protein n=1 Tax=Shewanella benthica KT99 TaxID=314608 RepID=A9D1N8_9GAMM|nr:hypothetical protein [Shewanella benthica]EDQ01890.1 hypothetical protein KT99_08283 [Shewanella benthica KT99]